MSKHTILFACGHIADAEVEGSEYQKKQKLIYLKIVAEVDLHVAQREVYILTIDLSNVLFVNIIVSLCR